jgi:hypothetical protein
MCVTNKHTSIPGTGLPVTAFTTVPEIRGVPIWKGEILSKKVTKFPAASFQKRTRTATTNATLGTAVVNTEGVATFSTTTMPQGSDVVMAAYAGNADYSSASANVTQVVN